MRDNSKDVQELSEEDHARLASLLMRRQGSLSVRVATLFLALVFGLPLVNHFRPDLANAPVFGFTATWLFLGVLFYPITWLLSAYFIRQSDRIEAENSNWQDVLERENLLATLDREDTRR